MEILGLPTVAKMRGCPFCSKWLNWIPNKCWPWSSLMKELLSKIISHFYKFVYLILIYILEFVIDFGYLTAPSSSPFCSSSGLQSRCATPGSSIQSGTTANAAGRVFLQCTNKDEFFSLYSNVSKTQHTMVSSPDNSVQSVMSNCSIGTSIAGFFAAIVRSKVSQ